jgi:Domain of unknown function (DUF4259)
VARLLWKQHLDTRLRALKMHTWILTKPVRAVVAGAEFVAAARDGDLSKLATARNDFAAHRQSLTSPHLIPLASQALERVLRKSELQELWAEGQDKSWLNENDQLASAIAPTH